MIALIKYSFILCFVVVKVSTLWEEIAGPYDIVFHHVSHCDKRGKIVPFQPMRARKFNRTHFVYSGFLDLGVDVDDSVKVKIVSANKGTNGRYNNVVDIEMDACEAVRRFGMEMAMSVLNHCNKTFDCPIKRVTCEMKNWIVNYNFNNIPALPYGEYKMDVSIVKMHKYNKREVISCVRFYGSVTPKMPRVQKKNALSRMNGPMSSLMSNSTLKSTDKI